MAKNCKVFDVLEEFTLPNVVLKPGDVIRRECSSYNPTDNISHIKFRRVSPAGGVFTVEESSDLFRRIRPKF